MCSLNHWTIREVPRSFSVQTNSSKYKEIRASQVALVVRNLPANAGDLRDAGLIPGLGRAPGGGHGSPLQFSCLENHHGRGAWRATVHGVTKSQTGLKWLSRQSQRKWPELDNIIFLKCVYVQNLNIKGKVNMNKQLKSQQCKQTTLGCVHLSR